MKGFFCYCILFFMASIVLLSCREDEEVVMVTPAVNLSGYIQKGPFINGTTLIITELDDSLAATGKTFTTQITDNRGSFSIKTSQLSYTNLQLIATGFYFDEVKGEKSAAQLTLFALADVSEAGQINVNVLSHLEKDRVMFLINEGKSFAEAKKQTQREILAIFGIEKENIANAERLDIAQDGEDNAILLAISAILQGNNTVAELSELLANITSDIRQDGTLDSEVLKEALRENAIGLNLGNIRQFVQKRYAALGVEAHIPAFEQYIDSDGDGILNKDDDNMPDAFVFAAVENAQRNTTYQTEQITLSGLPYLAVAQVNQGELLKNGLSVGQEAVYVIDGDVLQIKSKSSLGWSETVTAELGVGEYKTSFIIKNQVYPWTTTVAGFLQAGPFSNGASVTLTELDSNLVKTSRSFATQTSDSQGAYSQNSLEVNYPWALSEVKGYYYNFIKQKTSDGELQLTAYTNLSSNDKINANVLTHLESLRVKYLFKAGLSFAEAKQQALQEVLAIFEISAPVSTVSEHFDITQNNTEGAILLAVTAILQGYESTGTLQELLRNMGEDLQTDGILNNAVLGSALINNAFYLDLPAIRATVSNKYKELGKNIIVADFEQYVKTFKSNTDFILTKKIEYPATGIYGESLVSGTKTKFSKGIYGIYVKIPDQAKLTIKFYQSDVNNFTYGISAYEGWIYHGYDVNTQASSFTANQTGEFGIKVDVAGDFKIEIFENGATMPTRTINIVAY